MTVPSWVQEVLSPHADPQSAWCPAGPDRGQATGKHGEAVGSSLHPRARARGAGRHSPVSDQGREVGGELFFTCGNCRGPGSESREALARVNAAQALSRESHGQRTEKPGQVHLPGDPAGPGGAPYWRRQPRSAASWTACPSRGTQGAESRQHPFWVSWRPGAQRTPAINTKGPVGTAGAHRHPCVWSTPESPARGSGGLVQKGHRHPHGNRAVLCCLCGVTR